MPGPPQRLGPAVRRRATGCGRSAEQSGSNFLCCTVGAGTRRSLMMMMMMMDSCTATAVARWIRTGATLRSGGQLRHPRPQAHDRATPTRPPHGLPHGSARYRPRQPQCRRPCSRRWQRSAFLRLHLTAARHSLRGQRLSCPANCHPGHALCNAVRSQRVQARPRRPRWSPYPRLLQSDPKASS